MSFMTISVQFVWIALRRGYFKTLQLASGRAGRAKLEDAEQAEGEGGVDGGEGVVGETGEAGESGEAGRLLPGGAKPAGVPAAGASAAGAAARDAAGAAASIAASAAATAVAIAVDDAAAVTSNPMHAAAAAGRATDAPPPPLPPSPLNNSVAAASAAATALAAVRPGMTKASQERWRSRRVAGAEAAAEAAEHQLVDAALQYRARADDPALTARLVRASEAAAAAAAALAAAREHEAFPERERVVRTDSLVTIFCRRRGGGQGEGEGGGGSDRGGLRLCWRGSWSRMTPNRKLEVLFGSLISAVYLLATFACFFAPRTLYATVDVPVKN